MKKYWLREEIPIADELLALVPALTKEFLDYHTDFVSGDFAKGTPYKNSQGPDTTKIQSKVDAWKTEILKYTYKEKDINVDLYADPAIKQRFPTAVALTEKYLKDCGNSGYSILEKQSVIKRHTGLENRDNEFIRIHIPLIVPEGDIYFECEGVEIDWSDIWGFDNQLTHSAYNHTDFRRLVYLIDIKRSTLGIPVGEKYSREREFSAPPFERGQLPKVYHSCQIAKNIT
jgi:hypothetical protein